MWEIIKYTSPNQMVAVGRNGYVKQSGIEVGKLKDRITLYAVNSKGQVSPSARLEIPIEDIPLFINQLEQFL